ncbi:MAG TPA: flagellar motor protein MotD [Steroidobacteraceae bacterium]|nr:flagellar motor protein MotD [Steroidobacteraceae bacterium]
MSSRSSNIRRRRHEEHENHEAWAIPYGDLVTLLLAFFVVMYAISSVNNGKYRVLSASLNAAFRGTATTPQLIQQSTPGVDIQDLPRDQVQKLVGTGLPTSAAILALQKARAQQDAAALLVENQVRKMQGDITAAMSALIRAGQVNVARKGNDIEVQISNDILFGVGVAQLGPEATHVLQSLAQAVRPYDNRIRVEGHTDDTPIHTALYPSNWELSAARAASVVHLFMDQGVGPERLQVVGMAQYQPLQPNDTPQGRSANRRVSVIVLGAEGKTS